ncbi:MAG: hypothetical protein EA378_02385 [Phycisphaerales bacterium]|nr:MAG: hypothetical protein EA378_02385 [Phycisphaerales bacterium]
MWAWGFVLASVVGYGFIAWLASATDLGQDARPRFDERVFHLAEVHRLQEVGVLHDPEGSRTATTPGYHAVLSWVARLGLEGEVGLRLVGVVFSAGLLGTVAWWLASPRRGIDARLGAGLVGVLACSPYVVGSAAWIGPENAGWWGVAAVMLLCVTAPMRGVRLVLVGLALAGLMAIRQSHLWAAAVVWTAAWLTPEPADRAAAWWWLRDWGRRAQAALLGVLATLPAFAVVAGFAWVWGGLVPPNFQGGVIDPRTGSLFPTNAGTNPAAVTLALAVMGFFGPWFAAAVWPAVRVRAADFGRGRAVAVVAGAGVLAAVIATLPMTTYSVADGRFGGLWHLARVGPTVAERSLVMIALAGLGGSVIGWMGLALPDWRPRLVLLAALVAQTAAQVATLNAWQRYVEPIILLMLIAATALACAERGAPAKRWHWIPIGALAVVQAVLTWGALR